MVDFETPASECFDRASRTIKVEGPTASVIWLTGLSGSGKSTIASELIEILKSQNMPVEWIDGDEVRKIFPSTGFDLASRNEHVKRIGYTASRLQAHGIQVVVSLVSPTREARDFARGLCRSGFVEVYVNTPVQICEERDPKGLYRRYREGRLRDLTGLDSPYEEPLRPEVEVDTSKISLSDSTKMILEKIRNNQRQTI